MYEIKSIDNKIQDIDLKNGIVVGYFSTFDVKDSVGDIMDRNAFKKTLSDSNRKLHLLNHDFSAVIGIPDVLATDDIGLRFETNMMKKYDIENEKIQNSLAKDVLTMYAEGVIEQHSIGYSTVQYEIIPDEKSDFEFFENGKYIRGWRLLKEVKLYEGSSLTMPGANPFTPFLGFKSAENQQDILKKKMEKLKKIIKKGNFSDELYMAIDIALKQLSFFLEKSEPSAIDTRPIQPSAIDTELEKKARKNEKLLEYMKLIKNIIN